MNTLENKLTKWDENSAYKKGAASFPEIYADYLEFRATGKYPYLADVTTFILQKRGLSDEFEQKVHTQTYIASHQYRNEQEAQEEVKLSAQGYTKITAQNYASLPRESNVHILLQVKGILGRSTKPLKGRFVEKGFLPSRCRRKGYFYSQMIGSYYKPI